MPLVLKLEDYKILKHGFLNNTVYFDTLICPFSTKSLLCLHCFLLKYTVVFPKSQKTALNQRTPGPVIPLAMFCFYTRQYFGVVLARLAHLHPIPWVLRSILFASRPFPVAARLTRLATAKESKEKTRGLLTLYYDGMC